MSDTITMTDVYKSYKGSALETYALQKINLTLQRDQFTAIVGASGLGKSTLLSLMGTLDQPTSGSIEINGVDIAALKGDRLADFRFDRIGLVFQHFHLLPTLTALENVMSPFWGRKTDVKYKERAESLLSQLGLEDKAKSLPSQLSGGEQQRVAIARALVNEPDWLLADEPTGNLDSRNAEAFYELLQRLKTETGCGIVVVTHDLQLAETADVIVEIKDGRVVQERVTAAGETLC